ncbi:hypothetical protein SAMN02745664_10290 [Moraxella cuniculi DSM 21768]|uniref:ATP-grasp domain-containing protein n=1 Tax=Moraxella cuniculi DSM 21768 TaxID=1122245 RepID=A0A1N7DT46_9GAMM|nr:hypothetical protein B0189_03280 [Moraxella cuniculi]SIR78969.1 hypothetical protein SAMN02745664_10290 [Moraxella cuniculi DSM 21768]
MECFSFAGRHKLLSIHQKFKTGAEYPNPFVEIGHIGPADLTPQTWQLIETVVFDCLDRMGICDGPSHTEVILTDTGVKIVETHTRVGGDRIFHLLKLSTGIDVFKLSLQWFCQKTGYIDSVSKQGVAAVYFFHAPKGISQITGIDKLQASRGVIEVKLHKTIGDTVNELLGSSDRLGYFIYYQADDTPVDFHTLADLASQVNICTQPSAKQQEG